MASSSLPSVGIVVVGASGDLSKRKIFPSLFELFCHGLLPREFSVVGYARSKLSDADLLDRLRPFLEKRAVKMASAGVVGPSKAERRARLHEFCARVTYRSGQYDEAGASGFGAVRDALAAHRPILRDRLFYMAVPPSKFAESVGALARSGAASGLPAGGEFRYVLEKPFGSGSDSCRRLLGDVDAALASGPGQKAQSQESSVFRIDHYLGKEMVRNLLTLRRENCALEASWHRGCVAAVVVEMTEKIDCEGRAGYFDGYGIIRDLAQNHLAQILALVAMRLPREASAEATRDAKVAALGSFVPLPRGGGGKALVAQYAGYVGAC